MTLGSTFGTRGLGYLSYSVVGAVTGASISSFFFGGQQVLLSWTLPTVSTTLTAIEVDWSINGTYQATESYDPATTSITKAITGGQQVGARIRCKGTSGGYSSYTVVSAITTPPEKPTNFTVVYGGSTGTALLSWTNAATSTSTVITRIIGDSVTTISVGSASASYTDSPGVGGIQVYYTLTAVNGGGSAPPTFPVIVYVTDPNPPTIGSFTASNPGILALTSTAPAQTNIASYQMSLEVYSSGTWTTSASVTGVLAPSYTWGTNTATHGSIYRAKVRSVDTNALVSTWATSASVAAINDTVPPVVAAPTISAWDPGFSGFTVTRSATTDALSSLASVVLEVSYDGGASIYETVSVTGASGTTNHVIATAKRGLDVSYRIKATDSLGNAAASSWVTKTTKPLGTFFVAAIQTSTWETAGAPSWRTDTDDVVSGRLDASYETQSGFWFYGTGVADTCKGYAPDSGTLLVQRQGTAGFNGTVLLGTHTSTTRPTSAPTVSNTATGPDLSGTGPNHSGAANQVAYHTLSGAQLTAVGNGTAAGFASVDPGGYRRLAGVSSNGYSGLLTLVFN